MILVTGGTGRLGRRLVARLLAEGKRVRVLTRLPRNRANLPEAVEVVTGDLRVASDVAVAVKGCDTVVSAAHGFIESGGPESIDRDAGRQLIAAADAAGAKRFVLVSVVGSRADHPMSLMRAKHAAERALRDSSLQFTIIRATAFLETWISVISAPLHRGKALVLGPGTNPINFVSAKDVAALIVECLRDTTTVGETLEIGGPDTLGLVALARQCVEVHAPLAQVGHVPLGALRLMSVLARPFSPGFARKAGAAVVLNTTDMTFASDVRSRFPAVPNTTAAEVLRSPDVSSELPLELVSAS